MKFVWITFMLTCILLVTGSANASINLSRTIYFAKFKGNTSYCKEVVRKMIDTQYSDWDIFTNGNRFHLNDRNVFPNKNRIRTKIGFKCNANGNVYITVSKPRLVKSCVVEDGIEYCLDGGATAEIDNFNFTFEFTMERMEAMADPHYRLTINVTPSDARVQIMNIKPAYQPGILLRPGTYDLRISKPGYVTEEISLTMGSYSGEIDVTLKRY